MIEMTVCFSLDFIVTSAYYYRIPDEDSRCRKRMRNVGILVETVTRRHIPYFAGTDFDFDTVNFPFQDSDAPCSTSYGVYISQLIHFARVFSHGYDFDTRSKV